MKFQLGLIRGTVLPWKFLITRDYTRKGDFPASLSISGLNWNTNTLDWKRHPFLKLLWNYWNTHTHYIYTCIYLHTCICILWDATVHTLLSPVKIPVSRNLGFNNVFQLSNKMLRPPLPHSMKAWMVSVTKRYRQLCYSLILINKCSLLI